MRGSPFLKMISWIRWSRKASWIEAREEGGSIAKKIAGNLVRVLPILEKAFTLEEGENEV